MNQLKQAGKILEMYSLAGCERSVVISEFDSAEEVAKTTAALPFGAFMNWETYALADEMEVLKTELEIMKKAEQAFPAQK
jgi:muconolactone delta-isomerase